MPVNTEPMVQEAAVANYGALPAAPAPTGTAVLDALVRHLIEEQHYPLENLLRIIGEKLSRENIPGAGWEAAILRGRLMTVRTIIPRAEGIGSEEAAQLLGCTAQTLRNWARDNKVIWFEQHDRWMFPRWQFTADGRVAEWVPELIRVYRYNGIDLIHFLTSSRTDGPRFLDRLQTGQGAERVWECAERLNAF